jgi:hypothetical protein
MNAMEQAGDTGFVASQYKTILKEIKRVDSKWEQVRLGFALASILGKKVPHFARNLYDYSIAREGAPKIRTVC